jgi:hypothetical protein
MATVAGVGSQSRRRTPMTDEYKPLFRKMVRGYFDERDV